MASLSYNTPKGRISRSLKPAGNTIGRLPSCDIILSDPSVSRQHASIWRASDGWRIKDLGSRAGTRLNGEPVTDAALPSRGVLSLGSVTLNFDARPTQTPDALVTSRSLSASNLVQSLRSGAHQISPLARVVRAAAAMRRASTAAEVATILLTEARQATGADRAMLALIDDSGERRESFYSDETPFEPSSTFIRRVLDERCALTAPLIGEDLELSTAESLMGASIGSLMCAPLWTGEGIAGILYFDRKIGTIRADAIELILALGYLGAAELERLSVSLSLAKEQEKRRTVARLLPSAIADEFARGSGSLDLDERPLGLAAAQVIASGELEPARASDFVDSLQAKLPAGTGHRIRPAADQLTFLHCEGSDLASDVLDAARSATELLATAERMRTEEARWADLRIRMAIHAGIGTVGMIGGDPSAPEPRVLGAVWEEAMDTLRLSRAGRVRVTEAAGRDLVGSFDLLPEREGGAMAIWLLPRR